MKQPRMPRRVFCGLLLLLFFTLVGNAAAQQTCTPPPADLVSWWPGDGNTNDIADNNPGTLVGGVTFASGQVGQAFSLDGINDFVEIADAANLDIPGSLTVDAWIKLDQLRPSGVHNIISKENSDLPLDVNYNLHVLNNRLFFAVTFNAAAAFASGSGGCDAGGCFVTGSTDLDTAAFHHVAGVYDDSAKTMKVYLDGALDGTATFTTTGSPQTNNQNVRIGKRNAFSAGTEFKGLIDEVEIFNRALTAGEIAAIFNAGSAGKCRTCAPPPTDLISWWPGDGNTNDIADNNPGTLVGGVTFASGQVGQAFSLDGINDFVEVQHSDNLDMTAAYTLDAWVKVDEAVVATYRPILVRGASNANDIEVYVQFSSEDLIVAHNRGNGGTFDHVGFADPPKGVLFHLAVVFDGVNVQAYYDGAAAAVTQFTGAITMGAPLDTNKGWWIGKVDHPDFGADGEPAPDFFKGLIDEVEIFNRALFQSEIQAIVRADTAGKCRTCAQAPNNLVSWWPAAGNANDIVDGNHGTLHGNATFAAGMVGQAFSFDGSGDFVNIPDNPLLNIAQEITLDAWIKADSFNLPFSAETQDANIYVISKDTDVGRSYGIGVTDVDLLPTSGCGPGGAHAFMIAFTSGGIALACGSTALSTGVFHHLAGTYDSLTGEAKIYVNGVLDGTASVAPGSLLNSGPADVQIGARQYPTHRAFFTGLIDEVEIFDRALSADEIAALANAGNEGKCTGCSHGYWKNHTDAWIGFTTTQTVEGVFNVPDAFGLDSDSLLTALNYPGGKDLIGAARILLRQAVAALLNAAHPDVTYPRTAGQVIDDVNAALATTDDRATMLALASQLDADNNLLCPLD